MVAALFITFVVCLFVGIPVAFSLGVASLVYFLGTGMPIIQFTQRFFAGMDSFTLLCIPGFTFAGNLMNQGGISDKLLGFADAIVGHLSGGLAYANVLASMVFAGISGTALADTVSLGGIEIPMMAKQGYDVPFSVAVTAASSCILMGGGMCFVCWYESKKHNYPKRDRMSTFKEIVHEGKEAIWAIIMVAIILFGIMGGVMTPTEASIVCICYGTIVSFVVYRKLNLKSFYLCLKTTLSSSAAIMALVAFANVFAYILTKERIPNMIADAMLGLTSNKYIILLLINLFLIFVGMFMETIAAILILFPVLLQLATAVGVDPVQFGIIVVMNLVLGLCTPPVGVCLFAATSIGDKTSKDLGGPGNKLSENVVALIPFMISNFTVLALTTYVPALTVGVANLITGR